MNCMDCNGIMSLDDVDMYAYPQRIKDIYYICSCCGASAIQRKVNGKIAYTTFYDSEGLKIGEIDAGKENGVDVFY